MHEQHCFKAVFQKKHTTSGKKVFKEIKEVKPDCTAMWQSKSGF